MSNGESLSPVSKSRIIIDLVDMTDEIFGLVPLERTAACGQPPPRYTRPQGPFTVPTCLQDDVQISRLARGDIDVLRSRS